MATGGGEFSYDDQQLEYQLDHDEEQEVNTTQPFKPGAASSPYPKDEEIEMQTRQHEKSGQPDMSYTETSFLEKNIPL